MKDSLRKLEERLQALIEVRLASIIPGHNIEQLVAQQIAAAMQAQVTGQEDVRVAPSVYTLIIHPETAKRWQDAPNFTETLIEVLTTAAQESGFQFTATPEITLAPDETLGNEEVRVVASHKVDPLGETKGMTDEDRDETGSEEQPPSNAFLIVDGVKVFPLDKPVINVGRRMGNHLVIDDPRVSRNHAQLRIIKGRFVLFDLDSTGGTFINGQRVSQSVLYPGDVISLAGVPLIFGQDSPMPRPDTVKTTPSSPHSSDRPTAILHIPSDRKKK